MARAKVSYGVGYAETMIYLVALLRTTNKSVAKFHRFLTFEAMLL
jgi:hypothetical protein